MARLITQILLGFMLIFGVLTLIPKGLLCIRFGRKARGTLYLFLSLVCGFFAVMSFIYAYGGLADLL